MARASARPSSYNQRVDFDWPRISRWVLLATVVMTVWLLAPVAKCGFGAFKDTPLDEEHPTIDTTDAIASSKGSGFFETVGHATKVCYARTPMTDQGWKSTAFLMRAGGTIVAWGFGKLQRRR